MTHATDGAYPLPYSEEIAHSFGLTKREYFAAMAMQGLMANPERYKYVVKKMDINRHVNESPWSHEEATRHNAEKAVYLADALIEALNKEQP